MLGMMDKARIILDRLNNRPEGQEDVDAICEALEEIEDREPTRTLEQIEIFRVEANIYIVRLEKGKEK